MLKRILLASALVCLPWQQAFAGNNVTQSVGVCNPSLGQGATCLKPNGDGTLGVKNNASSVDASTTVTAGGVYQVVVSSDPSRLGCQVQNPPTASENLNVKQGTSIFVLIPGATYTCSSGPTVVTDTIQVTGATTGHAFIASYQP